MEQEKASRNHKGPSRPMFRVDEKKAKTESQLDQVIEETPVIYQTTTIKQAALKMYKNKTGVLPIVDAGTKHIEGQVTSGSILDYFGGGTKNRIIKERYADNIPQAVNAHVKIIMDKKTTTIERDKSIKEAIKKMQKESTGTVFITKDKEIIGKITSRLLVKDLAYTKISKKIKDIMQTKIITATPGYTVKDACEIMVKNDLKRLPIVQEDELVGIITYMDLLDYFAEKILKTHATSMEQALNAKISGIMSKNIMTLRPDDTIDKLCREIKELKHGGIPVTENGRLIGIVTQGDIMKHIK